MHVYSNHSVCKVRAFISEVVVVAVLASATRMEATCDIVFVAFGSIVPSHGRHPEFTTVQCKPFTKTHKPTTTN